MYYVISLTHTQKHENFITLWRPDNKGYCWSKQQAGQYAEPEKGYHDSDTNMPITIEEADKLFIAALYDGSEKLMIPNCKAVWQKLGVKMTRNGLIKIPQQIRKEVAAMK